MAKWSRRLWTAMRIHEHNQKRRAQSNDGGDQTPPPPPPTPVAFPVNGIVSSFTYAGQGAAEANLKDGNDTTYAADQAGLNSGSFVSYDLFSAKSVSSLRVKVAGSFGFGTSATFRVLYSDSSIAGAWVDTGITFVIPGGTGGVVNVPISAGSHRFWRIEYLSGGSFGSNAWLAEVTYSG